MSQDCPGLTFRNKCSCGHMFTYRGKTLFYINKQKNSIFKINIFIKQCRFSQNNAVVGTNIPIIFRTSSHKTLAKGLCSSK